jgi:hypothetical protein
VVHICEPEIGRNLSDEEEVRSDEDLINCQERRDGFSYCQVGNEMRSLEDLIDCQEDSSGNSYFQVGNDMRLAEDFINFQVGRNGLSSCQVGNRKRSVEGLIYCQRSSVESSNFQVGNEMGSVDLIDCQVGRREVPNCQVGRGKEMRLSESLRSSEVSSCQQGVLIDEDSCGFADHVNEDDEKLNTLTIQEEDQRSILIIGGIQIFLPNSPVEARACVADATTEEGQPTVTVMMKEKISEVSQGEEEEMEQTLMSTPTEGEEHSEEWLKIFSQEAETEMTAALEPAAERETDNMDLVDLYAELESLERRVMVQILHIQQVKLEADGGAYQPEEQLEEVGDEPTQEELTEDQSVRRRN